MHYPGVPSPYTWTNHPWPTRFHGGIWTRPTFEFPYQPGVQNVIMPRMFAGLGSDVDTRDGVYGSRRNGGGIFSGSSLYGLGRITDIRRTSIEPEYVPLGQADFPWREYSDQTKELQGLLNKLLTKHGYCPVAADGKLGKGTCAAIKLAAGLEPSAGIAAPDSCQEFGTPPGKCAPGGAFPGGGSAALPPHYRYRRAGMTGGQVAAIAAGAAAAIGIVWWMKKKKG